MTLLNLHPTGSSCLPACYIKKNMDWAGGDTHNKNGVYSMEECQDWCRQGGDSIEKIQLEIQLEKRLEISF